MAGRTRGLVVGVQTPSVASLADCEELRYVHQIPPRGQIVIVECLAHLDQLWLGNLIALPLKIQGGAMQLCVCGWP